MAGIDQDLDYLQPDFDPGSVTIPRLRNILVAHGVPYPATAKKSEFVDLFNKEIAPRAKRIYSARTRTRRTARGIEDVESVTSQSVADEDEDEEMNNEDMEIENIIPVVEDTPRRSSRRSTRQLSEASSVAASTRNSVARSSRQSSVRNRFTPDISEHDDESTSTAKPTKKRYQQVRAPAIKEEEESIQDESFEPADSPFSADNPFQSRSSPLNEFGQSGAGDRKRRTLDPSDFRAKPKATRARRKTEDVAKIEDRIPHKLEPLEQEIEITEEFTPEEQAALIREAAPQRRQVARPIQTGKRKGVRSILSTAPLAVLLASLGGVGFLWRQEKFDIGYCGVGREPSAWLGGYDVPEQLDFLQPTCEPCPPHAYCHADLVTTCEPDFILVHHPLSLNGLIPIPPACEPDSEKARKVQAVADKAVEELRERNAKFECGELRDGDGKRAQDAAIPETDLKQTIAAKRRRGMSQQEFEDLWSSAIGEISGREEVISTREGQEDQRLRSTSLARISLSCAIRRSIRVALVRNLWKVGGIAFVLISLALARSTITSDRETEAKAKQLASLALDHLATQAAVHYNEDEEVEPWISMAQLRDDVLRDEFSARTRQKLWTKVQKKVESNSNVRARLAESRTGEVSRVWEWVGTTTHLSLENGSARQSRRKSGRLSMAPAAVDSGTPAEGTSGKAAKQGGSEWQESRPIY